MPNLNECKIIGHVGKEPEMRFTPKGIATTSFSVAVNKISNKKDNVRPEPEWFNVVCWRRLAETVNQFVSKGMLIYVSGSITLNRWTGEDKKDYSSLQLNASKIIFLDKSNLKQNGEQEQVTEDDDIPF